MLETQEYISISTRDMLSHFRQPLENTVYLSKNEAQKPNEVLYYYLKKEFGSFGIPERVSGFCFLFLSLLK